MLLSVEEAHYLGDYRVSLRFNDGSQAEVDLKDTVFDDSRRIFQPLRDVGYFRTFEVRLNTICWPNEADFAPEFLRELAVSQNAEHLVAADG